MSHPKSIIEASASDLNVCSIPKTHRRLIDAHLLWHQALEQYHNPEGFRANLNAAIQELRNLTWILQSEKHAFDDFDRWYSPWQARMKRTRLLRWLVEARNVIVKEGELEAKSTALVKVITPRDDVVVEVSVPPDAPATLIVKNFDFIEGISNAQIPPNVLKSAAIVIERRWSIADLDGQEILEALAEIYGMLSEIVLDAHLNLKQSGCIPDDLARIHFPSVYHRTGTLSCMVVGAESRMQRIEFATGKQLEFRHEAPVEVDPKAVATRYGFRGGNSVPAWQGADPLFIAGKVLYTAKRILSRDKCHMRMMFIRDGSGDWHHLTLQPANRAEKHLLIRMVARFIESIGGDVVIDVGEAWLLPESAFSRVDDLDKLGEVAGRREELYVLVVTREGLLRTYDTPFSRGPLGGIKFDDTRQRDKSEYWPNYLEPIFEVWRKQGSRQLPDGKRMRRLWEPDPLDICFCGGPRRFGDCCKRLLESQPEPNLASHEDNLNQEFDAAITRCDYGRAEDLARAALAQYVIWVKQHTAPTKHVADGLYRQMLELDAPALDCLVKRLSEALERNDHVDFFLPQVHRVRDIIGVPELSVRLSANAARWLFEAGEYAAAVKELQSIGDLEGVNDTLALVLACKLYDLSPEKRREALCRSVANAFIPEERWFAKFELCRSLLDCDDLAKALQLADSVAAESRGATNHLEVFADAQCLREV
jgi:hypothetical protein